MHVGIAAVLLCAFAALSCRGEPIIQAWVRNLGHESPDYLLPAAAAVDVNGNILLTTSFWSEGSHHHETVGVSDNGALLLTNRHSTNGYVSDILIGPNRVWHVSGVRPIGADHVIETICYSTNGIPLWTNHAAATVYGPATLGRLALTQDGNLLLAAATSRPDSYHYDATLICYHSSGLPLWTNVYNGSADSEDVATDVAVGLNGHIYVAAAFEETNSIGSSCAIICHDADGRALWTNSYPIFTLNDYDEPVAYVALGTSLVTIAAPDYGRGDYLTLAYSLAGVPLWTNVYSGSGAYRDKLTAIAFGPHDIVYVTGASGTRRNGRDYATVAYSAAGVPLWTNVFNGPANRDDEATGVAADARGNVFVTGWSTTTNGIDIVTIAYSNIGVPLSTNRYDSGGPDYPGIKSPIKIVRDGIFVVGQNVIIKYLTGGPHISTGKAGNEVTLSWPSLWTNYVPQQSIGLNNPTWADVLQSPVNDGSRNRITLPVEPSRRLFRLRSQ